MILNFFMQCQTQSLESLVLSECLALLGEGSGEDSISNIGCKDRRSGESKTLTENIGLPTGVRGAADEAALSSSIATCKLSTAASHCIGQGKESCSSGKFANTEPRSLLFNLSPAASTAVGSGTFCLTYRNHISLSNGNARPKLAQS